MEQDQWVPIEKAEKLLGKSERSIQRLVQAGVLSQQRTGVNGHVERLYSARDLVRIKKEGISTTGALTLPAPRLPQLAAKTEVALAVPDALTAFFDRILKLQEFAAKVNEQTRRSEVA